MLIAGLAALITGGEERVAVPAVLATITAGFVEETTDADAAGQPIAARATDIVVALTAGAGRPVGSALTRVDRSGARAALTGLAR